MKKILANKNMIAALAILLIAVSIFIASFGIKKNIPSNIGPGFMPRVVAVSLFILGVFNVKDIVKKSKMERTNTFKKSNHERKKIKELALENLDWVNAILIMGYVLIIAPLGFLIASCIYMFLQMLLLSIGKNKNWFLIIGLSIGIPFLTYLSFTKIFYLMLPEGILG